MKTSLFNINRIGLLFQRYFTEHFRTELIYWIIMAVLFIFIRNMMELVFIAGIIYASRFFREIHSPGNGTAYFMIPATQLEKITVSIVLTSFYYFVMVLLTYSIGNLLGTFINNMLASINFNFLFYNPSHSPLQWDLFETVMVANNAHPISQSLFGFFYALLFSQSIFLLGSIYFKNNQVFKTFLTLIIIVFSLTILLYLETKLIIGDIFIIDGSQRVYGVDFNLHRIIFEVFYYLLPPFLWVVSYFRLTEKQV